MVCESVAAVSMNRATAWILCILAAPFLFTYFLIAYLLGMICALLIVPRVWLASQMYWSCPFIPVIFARQGSYGKLLKIGFEVSYTVNVIKRLLTLPIRRNLPAFYITGFPV